ncbi:hypothetical protein SAY86_006554 [Trapa natans]|uniref:Uncharacterized protein n=1 Tax=Trapa natans TaxID=22666 RepID=A0AAN7QW72_TRANT|nr:hypothetical protein SAY86_006554 [Trapa natans]
MAAPWELVDSVRVSLPASQDPSICRDCSHHPEMTVDNRHNFQLTGPPARLMYYCHGSWVNFPNRVVESLRPSFLQRWPVVDVTIDGSRYLFDFLRMLLTEFETGNQRSIAWMDDADCCFFPRRFVEEFGGHSSKRKKKEDRNEISSSSSSEEEEAEVRSSNPKQEAESKRLCLIPSRNDQENSPWANARLSEEGSTGHPLRGAACRKRSIAELFSMIRNALPPVKAQEVQNLYSNFRAGLLAKSLFAKQLPLIVGDDVLLFMIQEIRSSEQ